MVAAERQLQTMSTQELTPNQAVNLAPFGRWTLRDEAAQRRLRNRRSVAYRGA